jgi:environmental stress-induced protein Ves
VTTRRRRRDSAVVTVLRDADHRAMAWANGGGTTYEIACHPPGASLADFDWRVSLADIAVSGRFSAFEGVDRILTVIDGGGMALEIDGVTSEATMLSPVRFAGEATVRSTLTSGPTRDLNLMTRRGRCTGSMSVRDLDHDQGLEVVPVAGAVVLLVVVAGETALDSSPAVLLGARDAILVERPVRVTGTATVAWIEIRVAARQG